jgi:hypothetical protein
MAIATTTRALTTTTKSVPNATTHPHTLTPFMVAPCCAMVALFVVRFGAPCRGARRVWLDLFFFGENLVAEPDALIADVDAIRSRDQTAHLIWFLPQNEQRYRRRSLFPAMVSRLPCGLTFALVMVKQP